MIDHAFNLLASIVTLAIVTVLVAKSSDTGGVLGSFWNGFIGAIKAAMGR